jgi:hypothetical protein
MPDLFSPGLNPFVVTGVTHFEVFQKPFYQFASRGEDSQTDHDKEYSLKERKKEADNAYPDEKPTDDQNSDMF